MRRSFPDLEIVKIYILNSHVSNIALIRYCISAMFPQLLMTHIFILRYTSISFTQFVLPTRPSFVFAPADAIDVVLKEIARLHILHTTFGAGSKIYGGAI
jgi:hypothetical protein